MASTPKKVPRINYDQLNEILAGLGFVRKETDRFTVFGEQEHDALIVLPKMKADTKIGAPYLVTVRNTVAGKGIASREEIEARLSHYSIMHNADKPKSVSSGRPLAGKRRGPSIRSQMVSPLPK